MYPKRGYRFCAIIRRLYQCNLYNGDILDYSIAELNKIFDWRTFHIIVIRIAKKNIRRFLKFDEIMFCGISMFSVSWIATKTVDCGTFNFNIFEGPS